MKIKQLELKNFHGFDERVLTFSDQFTAVVGDNGSGKTAILDGLAVALGGFLSGFSGVQSRYIRRDEIYRKTYIQGGLSVTQRPGPARVSSVGTIGDQELEWARELRGIQNATTSKEAKPIISYASALQNQVNKGVPVHLPIISYYGTGRLWIQKQEREGRLKDFRPRNDRMDGYTFCLEPASSEKHFTKWLEKMTYIELQRKQTPGVLSAVRKAVSTCMKTWRTIEFDVDSEELRVTKEDGSILPFRLLSDGVRNMIGMVADIAHRMAMLNPALEDFVTTETAGVVLIDEIDLHLHPSWQRTIVNDLKRTFPKVQFIVTTHSPFIIQSLEEGELRRLQEIDDDEEVVRDEFVNKSIEDIAERVMQIEGVQRSEKLNEMYRAAQQYYSLLQNAKDASEERIEKLKLEMDRIESLYSSDVAYCAFLQMERLSAGLGDMDK